MLDIAAGHCHTVPLRVPHSTAGSMGRGAAGSESSVAGTVADEVTEDQRSRHASGQLRDGEEERDRLGAQLQREDLADGQRFVNPARAALCSQYRRSWPSSSSSTPRPATSRPAGAR
jgi:hypothetical protein